MDPYHKGINLSSVNRRIAQIRGKIDPNDLLCEARCSKMPCLGLALGSEARGKPAAGYQNRVNLLLHLHWRLLNFWALFKVEDMILKALYGSGRSRLKHPISLYTLPSVSRSSRECFLSVPLLAQVRLVRILTVLLEYGVPSLGRCSWPLAFFPSTGNWNLLHQWAF